MPAGNLLSSTASHARATRAVAEDGYTGMGFKALLERWRDAPAVVTTESRYAIRLDVDDAARVEALAALHPGVDAETVIADLLNAALDATEAAMPYEQGERVLQEDEFGDPVYEDAGMTPRYVELVRAHRDKLG